MPSDFELTGWLRGLGLGEDTVKGVLAVSGFDPEKVGSAVKSQVMAQAEFSRAMDKLRTDEEKLKADYIQKTDAELQAFATARSENDTRYQGALSARVEAEQKLSIARANIERLGNDYGIPKDALEPLLAMSPAAAVAAPAPTVAPSIDSAKFFTKEEFTKEAAAYSRLPIEYMRISEEHRALFGNSPYIADASGVSGMDKVLDRARTDKIPQRAAWEREFNVPAKRAEVAEAAKQSEIAIAVKAAETRVRSELALEGTPVRNPNLKLPGSPVLQYANGPRRAPEGTPTNATAPQFQRATASGAEDRVRSAVAAFEANLEKSLESPA